MYRQIPEVVGMRLTGWAALDREPQEDVIEFRCHHCGAASQERARRGRTESPITAGFMQDLQGEGLQCHFCRQSLRVVPVVLLHDQEEKRRFEAMWADEMDAVVVAK